jgi:eukaryotic-like serine/threonine-protein kinase
LKQLVDNRYRIVRPLGSGGMAEVYLAHDDVLDRDVAVKVMSGRYADDDEFVERFKREAQSAAALSHPNIVSIYDRGESEDGTYYIAMEYLPGGTLKDCLLRRGALPPHTAAAVALQIAEALHAAHRTEVVHRDIKPHNVLVTASGDVKVGDFGIARAASSSTMTRTGSILGTAHYISPEQAMGEPVGPSSDLYSLGIVLYEMLTGTLPYDAETPIGIAMKHVNGHLVPPRELSPEIPEGINAITLKLLAKNPDERYASAAELIEDLERVIEGLDPANATTREVERLAPEDMYPSAVQTHTAPIPPAPPIMREGGKRHKRRRLWAPILLLLILTLLGGLGYVISPDRAL